MLAHASLRAHTITAHILCLIGLIVSATPVPFIDFLPMPSWPLIFIFYYSVFYPTCFSPLSLAVYGLCYDSLHMAPLGTHAFFFPLLYVLMQGSTQRLRGRRLHDLWQLFIIVLGIYALCVWIFYAINPDHSCSLQQLFNLTAITAIAYPMIHQLLTPIRSNTLS